MIVNDTVIYPPLISTYFHGRRSNSAMVPSLSVTQPKPARKPAVAPHAGVVLASARNAARFADINSAKIKDSPKTLAMLLLFRSSCVKLLADIQARPNNAGEYQSPPITNVETAAAKTASQFR